MPYIRCFTKKNVQNLKFSVMNVELLTVPEGTHWAMWQCIWTLAAFSVLSTSELIQSVSRNLVVDTAGGKEAEGV